MIATERCPQCGTPVADDAPNGLCPGCLLQQGMGPAPSDRDGGHPDATMAYGRGAAIPDLNDVAARFPELEIIEVLGQGGMGVVYKARQPLLDRIVALKVLPPEVGRDPAFAERFVREARALAKLAHSNIVIVYDFGDRDGLYFLLMEYVEGVNLRQAIACKSISSQEALGVVPQICDALQYAHEEGVVHRDIKPENILLDKRGRVKIADFGLAKLVGRPPSEVTLTASHQVMGTLHYMAPEQLERPLEVDHRADIYSLGVVFYELLTGELPLGRFKLPSEKATLDERLDGVVLKTLEREPNERYQRAGEVKTDVERISSSFHASPPPHTAAPVHPPSRNASVPFTTSQSDAAESDVATGRDDHQTVRHPGKFILGVIMLGLGSCLLIFGIAGGREGQLWPGIGIMFAGASVVGGGMRLKSPRGRRIYGPHPGKLLLAAIMFMLGGAVFLPGVIASSGMLTWVGFGMAIAGGGVASGAWRLKKNAVHFPRTDSAPSKFAVGGVMLLIGVSLFAMGMLSGSDGAYFWMGFGLIVGGGGVLSGGWAETRGERPGRSADAARPLSMVELNDAVQSVRGPGIGVIVAGCLNLVPLVLLIPLALGFVGNMFGGDIPFSRDLAIWPLIAISVYLFATTPVAALLIMAGLNMMRLKWYGASCLASALAMLPCQPAFIVGLPMGAWSLWVLMRADVKAAFAYTQRNSAVEAVSEKPVKPQNERT